MAANYAPGGMVFAGDPAKVADRLIDLHRHLGLTRHFLQMDIGGMRDPEVLTVIELLGHRSRTTRPSRAHRQGVNTRRRSNDHASRP